MLLKTSSLLCSVIALSLLSACATPKRGDPEFAPALPLRVEAPPQPSDSIYQAGTAWLLMEDLKARRIGDMLTVTLEEKTDAEKTAETGTSKATSADIANPTIFGKTPTAHGMAIFDNSIDSSSSFDGKGDSSQSNSLTGSVTVTVVDVQSNGNLVVQGEKWININQGEEYIRLRGIVRPIDIKPDNTISSVRVANAQIQYSGDSTLASANETGWLARFFNSSWMPF